MTILKCKMCGGALEINPGETVAECPYCGTKQTIPTIDNEKKAQLFERANRLRAACMFDRALAAYEAIISDYPEEPEAYWGELLCKYGIEYVDDPATGKKIPTCHRSSYDSIIDDEAYEFVMQYANQAAREVYRAEAKQIEAIRRGINEISSKEEPYDVFICYKETDENGERTEDSVLAQDIYNALIREGYRVFFARITLEDKLGQEYEPYIFAALNSAKVMLVVGTEPDRLNAVWVKNEWSRYLTIISKDPTRVLIPCYKGITAYDLPKEFNRLQSQDLSKIGAIQDLVRGVGKIVRPTINYTGNELSKTSLTKDNIETLLRRAFLLIEDKEWDKANGILEQILNIEPENAQAYFGKLFVEAKAAKIEDLSKSSVVLINSNNYEKIRRFGDDDLNNSLVPFINDNCEFHYKNAIAEMNSVRSEEDLRKVVSQFATISNYKDAQVYEKECFEKINELQLSKKRKAARKRMGLITLIFLIIFAVLAVVAVNKRNQYLEESRIKARYDEAQQLMTNGEYLEAKDIFLELGEYGDSSNLIVECEYQYACELFDTGVYATAKRKFDELGNYKDSKNKSYECTKKMRAFGIIPR